MVASMRRRDAGAIAAIAVTVVTGLAALGGAPRWAACLTAGLGLGCALPYALSQRRIDPRWWAHAPLLALLALAALATALQLVPLPAALVAALAPMRHALAADTAVALDAGAPRWLPLSYDWPATLLALATLAGLLGLAYAAMRVAADARGRLWLVRIVAAAGVAMAACGLAHRALGLEALFGVYQPAYATPAYPAPLLNDNHLAGFLSLTAPLALALAVVSTGVARLCWVAGLTAIAATNLLVASRGGAISLAAGLAAAVAVLVVQRRRGPGQRVARAVLIPAAIVVACGVVLVSVLATDRIRDELARTSMAELDDPHSKFGVWRASVVLASDNPWTGVGRGAFEPAFTRLHESGTKTYSHVENQYLQTIVDWGVPVAAGLLALALWLARTAVRRWNEGMIGPGGAGEAGALAALVAMAVHSIADFHLELPGVAVSAVVILAVLVPAAPASASAAASGSPRQRPRPRLRLRPWAWRVPALAAGAAVVALAASPAGQTARQGQAELEAVLVRAAADDSGSGARNDDAAAAREGARAIALGRALVARHPSDYLLAGLLARAYFRQRDPEAVHWINRAIALNPKHADLRVLAARMLLAAGRRQQALVEYALALRYTLTPRAILEDLVRHFPDPAEAASGLPAQRERLPVLTTWLRAMERTDVALAYARRVYPEHAGDYEVQRIVSELAWIERDLPLAVAAGRPAYAHSKHLAQAIVLGQALRDSGHMDEAGSVLAEALELGRYDAAWQIAQAHAVLSDVHAARGDDLAARGSMRTAIRLTPGDANATVRAQLHRRLARIEERLGNTAGAAEARTEAEELEAKPPAPR
jgi:tetratricopeptide (TPR) repeat protein